MTHSTFTTLKFGIDKCLRMVETSSTQAHLNGTTQYIRLFTQVWERRARQMKDDDLDIALDAGIEILVEALHDRELSIGLEA